MRPAMRSPSCSPSRFTIALPRAPARAAMFEDDHRNLEVPHGLGMRTVLVGPAATHPHVHHQTEDLAGFLALLA